MRVDYDVQAQAFLDRFHLRFDAVNKGYKAPPWKDEKNAIHGEEYKVTLKGTGRRISFPFWNSHRAYTAGEELTPYDVLACLSSDIHCPETFEEFCREFGYDVDSRKAEATFRRCRTFADKLNKFFTSEEIEALREIR